MKTVTALDGKTLQFPDEIDPHVMDVAVAKYNAPHLKRFAGIPMGMPPPPSLAAEDAKKMPLTGPNLLSATKEAVPGLVGLASTALIPETAGASALIPFLLRAGGRTGISGITSGITDLGMQLASGQPLDVGHAFDTAKNTMVSQALGEGAAGVSGAGGNTAVLDANRIPARARAALPKIDEAILRERVPVGPGTAQQKEYATRATKNARAMKRKLLAAGPSGPVIPGTAGTPAVPATPPTPAPATLVPAMPVQGTAAPTNAQGAGAAATITRIEKLFKEASGRFGIPQDDLAKILREPPTPQVAANLSRKGMSTQELISLRSAHSALEEAHGVMAASAAPASGVSAMVPAPTMIPGTPAVPAVKGTTARRANPGIRHMPNDVLKLVDEEIASMRRSSHPDVKAKAKELQKARDAWAFNNRKGVSPWKLDVATRESQHIARNTYNKDAAGDPANAQTITSDPLFHRLLAMQGRNLNRDAVKGLAGLKDRARELRVLQKVAKRTESLSAPPLANAGDPTRVGPMVLRRSILAPNVESRAGFAMNDPRMLLMLREGLLGGTALNGLLNPPQPDTTQGGSR